MIQKIRKKINSIERREWVIGVILAIFFGMLFLDWTNLPSKILPKFYNFNAADTWLVVISTFAGSIISAMLLVIITEKDRKANTESIRESQRPYLDVSYMIVGKQELERVGTRDEYICFSHGNSRDKSIEQDEYLTLQIVNNGASVAIIEINKVLINIRYCVNGKLTSENIYLKPILSRLSIKSGSTIYIKFCKECMYKDGKLDINSRIMHSTIYYRDLFNRKYIDECELNAEELAVIHDNELISK